ncbi:MAG: phosphatase PAP2 family protein [Fimbriimonas sp.]
MWLFVLLIAFLTVGFLVRYSMLQKVDVSVSEELQEMSVPGLDQAMILISYAGSAITLILLACTLAGMLAYRRHFRTAVFVLLSLLSLPLDYLLKAIWERDRPDAELVHVVVKQAGYSFPSGHALGSTAVYGLLSVLAWIHLKKHKVRHPVVVTLATLPVLICISRVYLGAHWFSDVIGGMTLGIVVILALTSFYREDKEEVARPIDPSTDAAPQV